MTAKRNGTKRIVMWIAIIGGAIGVLATLAGSAVRIDDRYVHREPEFRLHLEAEKQFQNNITLRDVRIETAISEQNRVIREQNEKLGALNGKLEILKDLRVQQLTTPHYPAPRRPDPQPIQSLPDIIRSGRAR